MYAESDRFGSSTSRRREPFSLKATLSRLLAGEDLDPEAAYGFMTEMAEGNLSDPQLAGFLCALEAKGPTAAEIAACASVLRDRAVPLDAGGPTLDIVGCGGDNSGSFNLSSMAALAAAACGQPVAKHGGRAVSSFSGAADFFAALGYPLDIPPAAAERLLRETGFAFLFAPLYHSAMRHAVAARRELAVKTVMNLLGPLSNPAGAPYQVMGVPTEKLLEPMAEAAMLLGGERVMTVVSEDGLDEFSCSAPARCVLAERGGKTERFVFDPAEAGIVPPRGNPLRGGTAEDNVAMARRLMSGSDRGGLLDAVCLNAGAGLFVAGAAPSVAAGYARAKQAFADGAVAAKAAQVVSMAQALADSRKAS